MGPGTALAFHSCADARRRFGGPGLSRHPHARSHDQRSPGRAGPAQPPGGAPADALAWALAVLWKLSSVWRRAACVRRGRTFPRNQLVGGLERSDPKMDLAARPVWRRAACVRRRRTSPRNQLVGGLERRDKKKERRQKPPLLFKKTVGIREDERS